MKIEFEILMFFVLRLFPYYLRDMVNGWLNSLEQNSIATWNDLAGKFIVKGLRNTRKRGLN